MMSSFRFIRGSRGKSRVKCRGRVRAVAHSDIAVYKYIFVIHLENRNLRADFIGRERSIRVGVDSGRARQVRGGRRRGDR